MFKSQRGVLEQVTVKCKIMYLQRALKAGSHMTVSIFHGSSAFAILLKMKLTFRLKIIDYTSELMEDARELGWVSAKGTHVVLLCSMEESKVS